MARQPTTAPRPAFARPRDTAALALLVVLNASVWGWSIANRFVFDDLVNIQANPWIKDAARLSEAFGTHVAGFAPGYGTSFYRPMMHVLYAVAYAVAGEAPWAFHLLNVLLHAAAVVCVYWLTRAALARWGDPASCPWLPFVTALVFSVHPIHSEPIEWVAGITDLSYTAFGLLALLAYVAAFRRVAYALPAGVLLLVSLLCKETGIVVLVLMGVLEWMDARTFGERASRGTLLRLAAPLAAATVYVALRLAALGSFAPSAAQHPRGGLDLVAAASGLFARYMGTLAVPVHLSVMRTVPLDGGFADPVAVGGLVLAIVLVAVAIRLRRTVLVPLAMALVVLPVLPALYVPAIESGESVFGERYLYLPVMGLGQIAGLLFDGARRRMKWNEATAATLLVLLAAAGGAASVTRHRAWKDSLSLWTDAAAKAPYSAAAHEGLCFALYQAGRLGEALHACERALALDPARPDALFNRAITLLGLGRAREARDAFDAVLSRRPDAADALVNRGLACMMLGRPDEALASYRRAIEIAPDNPEAHNVMGVALVRAGRRDEAVPYLEQAVRLAPDNPEYRANLSVVREGSPQR